MPGREPKTAGIVYALVGTMLWGFSGTAASALFSIYNMPYLSLLTIRMLASGAIMLLALRKAFPSGGIWLFTAFTANLVIVQLSYLAAISLTNAPTATILQYLSLPMVLLYEIRMKRFRASVLLFAMMLTTLIGVFELTTSFPSQGLGFAVNPVGLAFGVISAVTAAVYVLLSRPMIDRFGAANSVAWGLAVGGIVSVPLGTVPSVGYFAALGAGSIIPVALLTLFVIIFGTILAFTLFIKSMESLSATQATIAAAIEPFSAAASSYIFLGLVMTPLQYLGGALIIVSIIIVQKTNAAGRDVHEVLPGT